jgi:hypothetical protein
MGVTKKVLKQGDGVTRPQQGDEVIMEYTGYLYEASQAANDYKGNKCGSQSQLPADPFSDLSDLIHLSAARTSRPRLASAA